jgi:Protein of unknown function (DUF2726)
MRIKDRILNISEEIVLKELSAIVAENRLRVFPKYRLSDVIENDSYLDRDLFSYYTRSHFDFVVTTPEAKPFMAIEYEGPFHSKPEQIARDAKKHLLCKQAGIPILRINANHVFRKYRGMNLLRWIIEVIQLQRSFDEAQEKGEIPFDEPFDPANIMDDGSGRKWPYWLSVTATARINKFVLNGQGTRAWVALIGEDDDQNLHSLEYIRVGDQILYVRTSVRSQDADIPRYDMMREVTDCEMGEQLASFLQREQQLISIKNFQSIHDEVCQRFKMGLSHSMGDGLEIPK